MLSSFLAKKILPAITLQKAEDALPVAESLLKGGLNIMEITFRTGVASQAIRLISDQYRSDGRAISDGGIRRAREHNLELLGGLVLLVIGQDWNSDRLELFACCEAESS